MLLLRRGVLGINANQRRIRRNIVTDKVKNEEKQKKGGKEKLLLMIPGPTEFETDVLEGMATKGTSHVSKGFIETFGQVLTDLPQVFGVSVEEQEGSLPLVVAGSGTLG